MQNVANCTPRKAGRRKSATSSIGRSWRISTTANATRRTTPASSEPTICALDQPASFPRRSAWTIRKSADEKETSPARSVRRAPGSRDSRSFRIATAKANAPTGTFTKKTHRQLSESVRIPPRSGPDATPSPTVDPQKNARDVERDDVPRRAAQKRGDAENDHAAREDEPAPVAIRERTGREDQRGKRDRVRVDDPLQTRQARVELSLDARQRDVDDRDVDEQHECRRANGDKRPAPCGCDPLHSQDPRSG